MHTCHILLVEADSVDEAFEQVFSQLNNDDYNHPEWSDWHNATSPSTLDFSGRWAGEIFFTPNENGEADPDEDKPNYLCYADDPTLAEQVLDKYLNLRLNELQELKSKAVDLSIYPYNPYTNDYNNGLYGSKKLAKILDDEWTPESYVYDLTAESASLYNFVERVKENPKNQWLIPVDFHF